MSIFEKNSEKKFKLNIIIVCWLLLISVLGVVIFMTSKSGGWLYDKESVDIDYRVTKLKFDLSADHMKYYYDSEKEIDKTTFGEMLTELLKQPAPTGDLNTYNKMIADILKKYYPTDFIEELLNAWNKSYSDDGAYSTTMDDIYRRYTNKVAFPFRYRELVPSKLTLAKTPFYYYVLDILNLYSGDFVIQANSTDYKTSTIGIGVKLKGGTTFSKNTDGDYYDENFNDMVQPVTFKFENTSETDIYANITAVMDSDNNSDTTGIFAFVLPYTENLPTANNNGEIDYRDFIAEKLSGSYTGKTHSYNKEQMEELPYNDLQKIVKEWNSYAISTYKPTLNHKLAPTKTFEIKMLFFADYETNESYFKSQKGDDKIWDTDTGYLLIKYNFKINVKVSLKNEDLTGNLTEANYNKEKDYIKFAGVSNMEVEGDIFFLQDNGEEINAKKFMQNGYIICNYIDSSTKNYIGKLCCNVVYRGFSPAYIRVQLIEQFTNNQDEIESINALKFNMQGDWYDNREKDLCFYSQKLYYSTEKDITTTVNGETKAKRIEIPVFKEMSGDLDDALIGKPNLTLKLTFLIEAVQPNRFEEIWGIDKIPSVGTK